MNVLITLTTAGADTGPFNLYSNTDSYVTAFATGIAKSVLVAGYTSTVVPTGTNTIRVKSTGICTNYVDLVVTGATPTTTTTTTPTPTTTSTTTAGGDTTTTTTTAGGDTTTTTTTTPIPTTTTTTTSSSTTTTTTDSPTTTTTTTAGPTTTTTTTTSIYFSFPITTGYGDSSSACGDSSTNMSIYGSSPSFLSNATFYNDYTLLSPFDGSNLYYKNTSNNEYVQISSIGSQTAGGSC